MNLKFNKMQRLLSRIAVMLMGAALMFGCSDDVADPPVIKTFVNGQEYSQTERLEVSSGDRITYRFEVSTSAIITDIKAIKYQVLSETIKIPRETLVGGLTEGFNNVIEGVVYASEDTAIELMVMDSDGNEVLKGFTFYVI